MNIRNPVAGAASFARLAVRAGQSGQRSSHPASRRERLRRNILKPE